MKPNFEEMSVPELRAYVLSHRDDMEAIRALFHHPTLKYQKMPPMFTPDGKPIEENIRIAEEALRKRCEQDLEKHKQKELQKEQELEAKIRAKIEKEVEEKLRAKLEKEIEEKIRRQLEQ